MNNQTLLIKVKERINKRSSFDYDSFEDWQILESFNKIQLEFSRRSIKRGEDSRQNIEDINFLLTPLPLAGKVFPQFFQSINLPENFLGYKRLSVEGVTEHCPKSRSFVVYLAEEANVDELYRDPEKCPNFEWAETFITFIDNRIRIHTDGKFTVKNPILTYYRKPKPLTIIGVRDASTGEISTVEQTCEFKEDLLEVLIDECALLLAGDIESGNQVSRLAQQIQRSE